MKFENSPSRSPPFRKGSPWKAFCLISPVFSFQRMTKNTTTSTSRKLKELTVTIPQHLGDSESVVIRRGMGSGQRAAVFFGSGLNEPSSITESGIIVSRTALFVIRIVCMLYLAVSAVLHAVYFWEEGRAAFYLSTLGSWSLAVYFGAVVVYSAISMSTGRQSKGWAHAISIHYSTLFPVLALVSIVYWAVEKKTLGDEISQTFVIVNSYIINLVLIVLELVLNRIRICWGSLPIALILGYLYLAFARLAPLIYPGFWVYPSLLDPEFAGTTVTALVNSIGPIALVILALLNKGLEVLKFRITE